jgi:tetratricopeptide (TPR) repeat protein
MGLSIGTYGLSFMGRGDMDSVAKGQVNVRGLKYAAFWLCVLISIVSAVYSVRYFKGAAANNKGLKYLSINQYNKGVESFKRALRWNPTFITSYYKLAHAYNQLGDTEKALETYYDLARYAPDYSEIHYNFGVVHASLADRKGRKLQAGNLSEEEQMRLREEIGDHKEAALEEFETASRMSNKPHIKYTVAMVYKQYGMLEKAFEIYKNMRNYKVKFFDESITEEDLKRIYQKSEIEAARLAMALGKYEYAEEAYRDIYSKYPGEEEYFRGLETIYNKYGKREKLYDLLKEALSYNPLDPVPRMHLARAYLEDGEFKKALEEALIAEKLASNKQAILPIIAEIYYQLGDEENFKKYKQYLPKILISDRHTS